MQPEIWRLGEAVADLGTQRIDRGGQSHRLTPRAAAVLRALIEAGDRPLSRDAALNQIWGNVATGDEVVGKAINELRQALGDTDPAQRRYIETIPKLGYRLICTCAPAERTEVTDLDVATAVPEEARVDRATAPVEDADADVATAPERVTVLTSGRRPWRLAVLTGCSALVAVAGWLMWPVAGRSVYDAPALAHALTGSIHTLAPAGTYVGYGEVLPDGRRALFSTVIDGHVRVVSQGLDGSASTRIGALPGGQDFSIAVAHDGRTVAYQHFDDNGACRIRLHRLPEGTERELGSCSTRFAEWMTFSPDGEYLVTPRMRPGDAAMSLHRIRLSDGQVEPLDYPRDAAVSDVQAHYSPDGRYLAIRRGPQPHSGLWLLDIAAGRLRELVPDYLGLDGFTWLPDSRGLVIGIHRGAGSGLWRVDAGTGQRDYLGLPGATDPILAREREALLFCRGKRRFGLAQLTLDGTAEPSPTEPLRRETGSEWFPRRSFQGDQLAYLADPDGRIAVYVAKEAQAVRLPDIDGFVPQATPAFSGDGKRLIVPVRNQAGDTALFEADLANAAWSRLGATSRRIEQVYLSADDKWIYYVSADNAARALWRRSRETGVEQSLASPVERGPISGDAKGGIFYIDTKQQALVRRSPEGAVEKWVDDMGYWTAYGWTPADDGIYAVLEPAGAHFGVYFVAAAGAAPVLVEPMDGITTLGMAMRDGSRTLDLVRPPRAVHDLVWVDLRTAAKPPSP
ncbi:winged helix-turn-helix domain-containing protein [Tahibacter amnicola]|uniref:Winged helix-turn-helix domain-containing protein n=1 Tax=Tahibacter amnicola TaxID=2976241 RepID=A0ABY6BGR2_9GAMM|nr:winged helix-turn-helix domain-containing protein [Tahibacter amnicola]UXI68949.1 winged helix-turn-helix domain-containing protein [Tahibacter amnicola]